MLKWIKEKWYGTEEIVKETIPFSELNVGEVFCTPGCINVWYKTTKETAKMLATDYHYEFSITCGDEVSLMPMKMALVLNSDELVIRPTKKFAGMFV